MTRNPCCIPSTAVARMHPLVEQPARTRVSTPSAVSIEASGVPKKALAYCFTSTTSFGKGASSGTISAARAPGTSLQSAGILRTKRPPSAALSE
jgi:hypothetical protein